MIEIDKSIEQGFSGKPNGLYDVLVQLQNLSLMTEGQIYYVCKKGNSTTGKSWANAFTTIAAAITASNATVSWAGNREDNYILIAPGTYAENLTSLPYYTTIIGLGVPGTATPVIVYLTGGSAVAATTVLGTRIYNVRFEADGAVNIFQATTMNDCEIVECTFCANDGDVVDGLEISSSTNLTVKNCKFIADTEGTGMTNGMYFGSGTNFVFADIIGNIIAGCDGAGTGIYVNGNTVSSETVIRNNIIKLGGAGVGISVGQTGSAYKQAMVIGNYIFTQAGTCIACDTDFAINNWHNNGTTVTNEPNMPT